MKRGGDCRSFDALWTKTHAAWFRRSRVALVKAAVSSISTGKTEHIWIEDAGFEDDMIVGTVSSEPNQIPEIAKGDWITVSPDDLSDWVYRLRGRTFGGFTVKLMQRRGEKW
jgi:uncharacterized protein YegJ (DUF2314 family)